MAIPCNKPQMLLSGECLRNVSYEVVTSVVGSFGAVSAPNSGKQHSNSCGVEAPSQSCLESVYQHTLEVIEKLVDELDETVRDGIRSELVDRRFSRHQIAKWQTVCHHATEFAKDILTMVLDEKTYGIDASVATDIIARLEEDVEQKQQHLESKEGSNAINTSDAVTSTTESTTSSDDDEKHWEESNLTDVSSSSSADDDSGAIDNGEEQLVRELERELKRLDYELECYEMKRKKKVDAIQQLDREQQQRDQLRIELLTKHDNHVKSRRAALAATSQPSTNNNVCPDHDVVLHKKDVAVHSPAIYQSDDDVRTLGNSIKPTTLSNKKQHFRITGLLESKQSEKSKGRRLLRLQLFHGIPEE